MLKNKKCPFFSILIPSYNRPEFINQCINSILENDFDSYEIIISDDRSPKAKEIKNIIEPYLNNSKIRFYEQAVNLREPDNKNFLVNQANGKYTIIIGDDDVFYSDTLIRLYGYIKKNPNYDLYGLGYTVIDENNRVIYKRNITKNLEISLATPDLVKLLFFSDMFPFWLYHAATFCCKNGVEKEIGYSKEAGIGEDFLFIFDLINTGRKIIILPEIFFMWRKIQAKKNGYQLNQSLIDYSNIKARNNILNHLMLRKNLNPQINKLIYSFEFRKRFLYNQILSDGLPPNDINNVLSLQEPYKKEFKQYADKYGFCIRRRIPYLYRIILYILRMKSFVRLFGFKGFILQAQNFFQRIFYKLFLPQY